MTRSQAAIQRRQNLGQPEAWAGPPRLSDPHAPVVRQRVEGLPIFLLQATMGAVALAAGVVLLIDPPPRLNWMMQAPALLVGSGLLLLVLCVMLLAVKATQAPASRAAELQKALGAAQRDVASLEADLAAEQAERGRVVASLDQAQATIRRLQEQLDATAGHLPQDLVAYYARPARDTGNQIRRVAQEIEAPWRAAEGTLATQPLKPFLDLVQTLQEDAQQHPPMHHLSTLDALERLKQVSDAWRADPWFQKALRWLQERYPTR